MFGHVRGRVARHARYGSDYHHKRDVWGGSRLRERLFWGVALIALGVGLMLAKAGVIPGAPAWSGGFGVWHGLAALVVVSGLAKLFAATHSSHILRGLGRIAIGGWVLVCLEHVQGWSFANSWPVLLIVWGLATVATMVLSRRQGDEGVSR